MKRMMSSSTRACHHQTQSPQQQQEEIESVIKYHQNSKHSLKRYARGPYGLDWANQPNPFRRYNGARVAGLDHEFGDEQRDRPYPCIFHRQQQQPQAPLTKGTLSQLLYDSLALSAWKTTGVSTWPLRVNPSSGNLHPTEGYVICGPVPRLCDSPFVAHYAPKEHALEIRTHLPPSTWKELTCGFPAGSLFIGLSSIFWREAWKYGERAFRYCNHDVGHAVGAVAISAANLGWQTRLVDSWTFQELQLLLGLSHTAELSELEQEHGDCVMALFPGSSSSSAATTTKQWRPSRELISGLSGLTWTGKPNTLSPEHVRWDAIYEVAQAAAKKQISPNCGQLLLLQQEEEEQTSSDADASVYKKQATARAVVRSRRSAVSMDGRHVMQRDAFYQILLKSMPTLHGVTQRQLPFAALPWTPEVGMVLFVHRVADLCQGIYFVVRNPEHQEELRTALRAEFVWQKPPGCPSQLPLYLLASGDTRAIAERLSCHQEIASDGCFSLGMVARFEDSIREHGAWMYPRLFWEAGLLGQLLYLEAHALGISATGIGCYFDDAVHQLLGIKDMKFQSMYHFTIGAPVVDKRIMSLPPYPGPSGDSF